MIGARPGLWAALLLLLLPIAVLGEALKPGSLLASAGLEHKLPWASTATPTERALPQMNRDAIREQLAYEPFLRETLGRGEIPWWSPYMYGGWPFLALGRTAVLYPVTWLKLLLDPLPGHAVGIALHLALAGLGALVWLRAAGLSRWAALVGAVAFMLNGMFATRHDHPQFVATACWLPWSLLGIEWLCGRRPAGGLVLVAAATALAILAGHPSVYVYGHYFVGVYLVFRLGSGAPAAAAWSWRWRTAGLFGLAFASGVGLASTQLLATLELSAASGRAERSIGELGGTLPHWSHLFRLVFPDALGNPIEGTYRSFSRTSYVAGSLYAGVAPLLLAIVGTVRGGLRGRVFGVFAAVCLAVMFLPPLFAIAYHLPGFQFSRVDRLAIAYFLCVSLLAALGVDALRRSPGAEVRGVRGRLLALLGLGAGLALVAVAWAVLGEPGAVASRSALRASLLRGAVLWLVAVGLVAFPPSRRARSAWASVVLGLCVVELATFARGFVVIRDPARVFRDTPATRFLRAARGPFRIAKYDPGIGLPGRARFVVFPANTPGAYGIEDIHGYSSLRAHDLDPLLEPLEPEAVDDEWRVQPFRHPETLDSPLLDLLQVRFVLAAEPMPTRRLRQVHQGDVYVYENPDVMPRASFVPAWRVTESPQEAARQLSRGGVDLRQTVLLERAPPLEKAAAAAGGDAVEFVDRGLHRVVLRKVGPDAGLLLLLDAYYPGWRATVDGAEVEVLRANVAFRAVAVGAGEHEVVFEYRPAYLGRALWATGGGAVLLAGGVLLARRGGRS